MLKPVEPQLLSGAPTSLVADGQFVGADYPLPVALLSGHTINSVVSEIVQVEGADQELRLHRPGAGLNLNRFALRLPSKRMSIDALRFHFTGWTAVNAYDTTQKSLWVTPHQGLVFVLESPYKTYQEAITAVNADSVNRWLFLETIFLNSLVYNNLRYNTGNRDLFVISGFSAFSGVHALEETKDYRYAVIVLQTSMNASFGFSSGSAYAYWTVGWSPRAVSMGADLASGSN